MIDDISMAEALEIFKNSLLKEEKTLFFTPNIEMIAAAFESEQKREVLNLATVSLPDGSGLKIIGKLLRHPINNTVPGIDFGARTLGIAASVGQGIFLLGGADGVAERAAKNLVEKIPSLKICGVHNGFFDSASEREVIEKINLSGASVLIVCMGFSRQEEFAIRTRCELELVKSVMCLGGSLDVWSGAARRAPVPFRRAHLEWAWRIIHEPRRARRFLRSLRVLLPALRVFLFEKGMKGGSVAYNQTKQDDRGG